MATDLAEILADLRRLANDAPREDPAVAADARIALSRLRPALQRLRDDGISPSASTAHDPDAFKRQADRVHWVDLLAGACDRLGAAMPTSGQFELRSAKPSVSLRKPLAASRSAQARRVTSTWPMAR